ncbi:rCG34113, isoform CRA_b [Rattus norvegicus]|uniref:RCG34113, isoform CRA_b n=1 Tax=Rattus norvegicus TaxID=10116 RepID=A6HJ33_RAT|nr:rCG34113, isoform CRA_b [Rattus norvegicus]
MTRWRSGENVTWTPMTLCWRRTRRWTWSMGCCSTSCARGTVWSYRAPKAQAGPFLSQEEESTPTKPPLSAPREAQGRQTLLGPSTLSDSFSMPLPSSCSEAA